MTPVDYRVQARNLSHASENKIHDDDVARRFGFTGGLVAGVEVYAYMTHLPVARWGVAWLERGTAECRFLKPVYDGRAVTVRATEKAPGLAIALESDAEACATGAASLADDAGVLAIELTPAAIPEPDDRPDANEVTLAIGRQLSSRPVQLTPDQLGQYLADIGETEPLYARDNIVHPAFVLRLANLALKDNVKLGPWVHVGSSLRHCGLAHVGESLAAHAEVAANYERGGHRFVDLDVVIVADEIRQVARLRHTAIYRLRQAQ